MLYCALNCSGEAPSPINPKSITETLRELEISDTMLRTWSRNASAADMTMLLFSKDVYKIGGDS